MLRRISLIFPLFAAIGIGWIVRAAAYVVPATPPQLELPEFAANVEVVASQVDARFEQNWAARGLTPAAPASELQILRRLSLALHGSIPSLEDLRRFEADVAPGRLERWAALMVQDRRFAEYFANRLSRVFVGTEGGQFIIFRRDRFQTWLADQLHQDRPLDAVIRDMIESTGLWTGEPATNYITQAFADDQLDVNKLAGRTVRAFLGQRIDCAQCHNHPFAHWKQEQFEGLAACFGQARISVAGVGDDRSRAFTVTDRGTLEDYQPEAGVPFGQEWWPEEGAYRHRLAAWITHPDNVRLERAVANRVWGLMFGRAFIEPVDDLPDPPDATADPDILQILGADFRQHGCRIKRLVLAISATRVFRMDSKHSAWETGEGWTEVEAAWAVFPLVRLRPEQIIGAMCQAASIRRIDQNSHLLTRFVRFIREQDFVRDYGDPGEQELTERAGTIPQALLRMNGRFAREISQANALTASGRIASMSPDVDTAIELAFLCCLTRYPTPDEVQIFLPDPDSSPSRGEVVEDVYWTLFNSPEFCWNH